MSRPSTTTVKTGDPWIDAYLKLRQAWIDGADDADIHVLALELRRDLPQPQPPIGPVTMFIQNDIEITSSRYGLTPALMTALWVPNGDCAEPSLR